MITKIRDVTSPIYTRSKPSLNNGIIKKTRYFLIILMIFSKKITTIPSLDCLCAFENLSIMDWLNFDKIYCFSFLIFSETNSFHLSASSLDNPLMLISEDDPPAV